MAAGSGGIAECFGQISIAAFTCVTAGGDIACCQAIYDQYWWLCFKNPWGLDVDGLSHGNSWGDYCDGGGGGGGADGGGGGGTGDDTGGTACGDATEEVTGEAVTINGEDCTYSGTVHNGVQDGECITWIVDGEGVLTCITADDGGDGDGGDGGDGGGGANFPIPVVVGAGG